MAVVPIYPPFILTCSQPWLEVLRAGMQIGFEAQGPGAGAAIFCWSCVDPYEQLSDAYTFMELRRAWPDVGDRLYSTLRRPILTVKRDDPRLSIDLLRHDYWLPRAKCLEALAREADSKAVPAPDRRDWPYAVNLFARTRPLATGDLVDESVATAKGSRIEFVAAFDVVVAVMAAGIAATGIDICIDAKTG